MSTFRPELHRHATRLARNLESAPLAALQSETLDALGRFVDSFRGQYPFWPDSAAYRVIADAFDIALGDRFIDILSLDGETHVTRRTVIYTPNPTLTPLFRPAGGRPITSRDRRPSVAMERCIYFRLPPASLEPWHPIVLYQARKSLESFLDPHAMPQVSTCHPHAQLSTDYEVEINNQTRTFGPVQPTEAACSDDRLVLVLNEAASGGAAVVVLPELSIRPEQESIVRDWFTNQETVRLLVGGSAHVDQSGFLVNRSQILVEGLAPIIHEKMIPFRLRLDGVELREDIRTGDRVTVLASRYFNVSVLICADLLEPSVAQTVEDLGINFLLVAAMSPVLFLFEVKLGTIVGENLAIVALANSPAEWGRPDPAGHAVFGRPAQERGGQLLHVEDGDSPGVATYDIMNGGCTWTPLNI